jgi:uncharacterized cofD-like protein
VTRPRFLAQWQKWFTPGLGLKRWLLLFAVGVALLTAGVATMVPFVPHAEPGTPGAGLAGAAIVLGGLAIAVALYQFNRRLVAPLLAPGRSVLDELVRHQERAAGPKVVTIGGGTGLSTLLRGLKAYTHNITAIVTVADDGGSSGRLRRSLGVLPPGDFRNCIAALADDEALTTQLFQYRFGEGEGLAGHSFGNLFIAAMAGLTGSFERALLESSRVLAVRGRIIPSTLEHVTLAAELAAAEPQANGRLQRVEGESKITEAGGVISRVFLQPERVRAYPEAVRAILAADLIVLGPGSLYTSVLPNLLVEDIARAIHARRGVAIYACNVATQRGETDGYDAAAHVAALERHAGRGIVDVLLANNRLDVDFSAAPPGVGELVRLATAPRTRLVPADLIDERFPWRHDSAKLAREVVALVQPRAERAERVTA